MNIISKVMKLGISWIHLIKYKMIYGRRFKCTPTDMINPSVKIRLSDGGKLILGKHVGIRDGVIINSTGGTIVINDKVFINDLTCINSRESVLIGSGTIIGQGVKIYDHDHDYCRNLQTDYICSSVVVGDNVWIGSDALILRGSKIGDRSVVGAATLLKGIVEPNSIITNERTTKIVKIDRDDELT